MATRDGYKWTASLDGTYTQSFQFAEIAGQPYKELVGQFFTRDLYLRWKHNATLSLAKGDWSGLLSQNYSTGYKDQLPDGGKATPPAGFNPDVDSYTTYNLSATYTGFKNTTLTVGILNLLDTDPPFTAHNVDEVVGAGWDPRVADPRGRSLPFRPSTGSNTVGRCGIRPLKLAWSAALQWRRRFFLHLLCYDKNPDDARHRPPAGAASAARWPPPPWPPPCRPRPQATSASPMHAMNTPDQTAAPARRRPGRPDRARRPYQRRLDREGGQPDRSARLPRRQGANLREVHGNYAGSVQQRLADLHAMFADPEVKAIWCIRGGSGCISLLAAHRLRADPRQPEDPARLLGHHRAAPGDPPPCRAGHLPRAGGLVDDVGLFDRAHAGGADGSAADATRFRWRWKTPRRAQDEPHYAIRTVHAGEASGPLMGGNLIMVSALAGTPYAADFRDSILFIEEVNEAPYRIDRWMTQLDLAVGLPRRPA